MFLPIGDTPNPLRFRPWVNWGLIAINIVVYLVVTLPLSATPIDLSATDIESFIRALQNRLPLAPELLQQNFSQYDLYTFRHGYRPAAPEVWDAFTALFLHGGLLHLAGNMLFLWIYGDNLEHRLGRIWYLLAYFATGIVATLAYAFFNADSQMPLVGASGAISGVLGAYFVFFPRNKIKVLVLLFPFVVDVFLLPARLVLAFYLLIDNLVPIFLGSGSNVAYGAHVGGFIAGAIIALATDRWPARPAPTTTRVPVGGSLTELIQRGQIYPALASFRARPDPVGLSGPESVALAEWLIEAEEPDLALIALRHGLRTKLDSRNQARAYLVLGLIRLHQGQPTTAYQHLMAMFDFDYDSAMETRARDALQTIQVYRR